MTRHRPFAWIFALLLAFLPATIFAQIDQKELLFVGSGRTSITAFWLNLRSGSLEPVGIVAEIKSPSFLAVSPDNRLLYAVSEGNNTASSSVAGYKIDPGGTLTPINSQLTGGAGPCFVSMDHAGQNVLVANYNSGSVATFHIDATGALEQMASFIQDRGSSVNQQRQQGPHAHCIVTSPDDRFAFVCDLGLDKVMIFRFDTGAGKLAANVLPFATVQPGEGPRHIAFHPNGQFAYVVSEMGSTITAFIYDSVNGGLRAIADQSLLPPHFAGESTGSEVAVHPSGKFVYASNRGDDSIVEFACEPRTGRLTFAGRFSAGGRTPRNFEIDPTGAYLLAGDENSGTIAIFSIDQNSGALAPTGVRVASEKPECIVCLNPVNFARNLAVPPGAILPGNVAPAAPAAAASPAAPGSPSAPAASVAPAAPAAPATPVTPPAPSSPQAPNSPPAPAAPAAPQ